MAKHVRHSVAPIYLFGAVWLVFGLFLSLHTLRDYVICALVSAVVYVAGKAVFPDRAYELPGEAAPEAKQAEPAKEPRQPEDPQVAALRKERERAVSEMRRLNDAIPDEQISGQIDRLEALTGRILDHVAQQPEKLPQIRRFLDYYLPTTLKILNAYDRMSAAGLSGESIAETQARVERMLDTVVQAFQKQLDALFQSEAMDLSAEITVMERMLEQEGLGKEGGPGATLEL